MDSCSYLPACVQVPLSGAGKALKGAGQSAPTPWGNPTEELLKVVLL